MSTGATSINAVTRQLEALDYEGNSNSGTAPTNAPFGALLVEAEVNYSECGNFLTSFLHSEDILKASEVLSSPSDIDGTFSMLGCMHTY